MFINLHKKCKKIDNENLSYLYLEMIRISQVFTRQINRLNLRKYRLKAIESLLNYGILKPSISALLIALIEPDTEIKNLIIDQLGKDNILKNCPYRILDKWNDYELLEINDANFEFIIETFADQNGNNRELFREQFNVLHVLKMINPTTYYEHYEFVPPSITTCKQALSWRINGLNWEPIEIT